MKNRDRRAQRSYAGQLGKLPELLACRLELAPNVCPAVREFEPTAARLGLAIAKSAIEAHGGTLMVRNEAPTGCTFIIDLPAAAPPPEPVGNAR